MLRGSKLGHRALRARPEQLGGMIATCEKIAQPGGKVHMNRISPQRALCTSLAIALTALLTLLAASPSAFASVSGSTRYEYKVVGVNYKAEGAIIGWHVKNCVGTTLVEGVVTTEYEIDIAATFIGKLSLTIHGHGSSGSGYGTINVKSQLSNGLFRETTVCDSSEK